MHLRKIRAISYFCLKKIGVVSHFLKDFKKNIGVVSCFFIHFEKKLGWYLKKTRKKTLKGLCREFF